jgi:hypothetical protein
MSLARLSRPTLREPPSVGCHPKLEPDDVARAPELALLEASDAVLETAVIAVIAANPALVEPDLFEPAFHGGPPASPRLFTADAVVYLTHALRCAIDRYRCALRDEIR